MRKTIGFLSLGCALLIAPAALANEYDQTGKSKTDQTGTMHEQGAPGTMQDQGAATTGTMDRQGVEANRPGATDRTNQTLGERNDYGTRQGDSYGADQGSLPATATPLPLLAALGALSLGAGAGIRRLRTR